MKLTNLIPVSTLEVLKLGASTSIKLPFIQTGISAGFPSPAEDYLDLEIDLVKVLIKNPSSTFVGRVRGYSMQSAGIHDQDIIIIDRSIPPTDGKIAVCCVDGEFTLKRISIRADGIYLLPANIRFNPIKVHDGSNFSVWGIMTHCIKAF